MSYDIRDSSSLESLREYVQGVAAGLEARPAQLGDQVAPWLAADAKISAARDARDVARFARVRAIRRYAVLRTDFVAQLTTVSGTAYLAASKVKKAAPYSTLFGSKKAEDYKDLGFNNLRDGIDAFFKAAESVTHDKLTQPLADLKALFVPLKEAGEARKAARLALIAHETTRANLVLEVEDLGAATEAAILNKSPGRSDLVRAVLSTSLDTGKGDKKDNEEPAPTEP